MSQSQLTPHYPSRSLMQFIISSVGRYGLYTDALVLLTDYVADYTNQHESSRFPHSYIDHELSRIEKYVTRAITRVSESSDTLESRRILDTRRGLIAIRQNIYDNREIAVTIRLQSLADLPIRPDVYQHESANIFVSGLTSLYTTLRILRRQFVARTEQDNN
ncbi:MAG: hypothetical protein J0M07_03055 [Anaerolineae bacterium]|nr:hypothetical protein [Anaerolineae bacterium]